MGDEEGAAEESAVDGFEEGEGSFAAADLDVDIVKVDVRSLARLSLQLSQRDPVAPHRFSPSVRAQACHDVRCTQAERASGVDL